MGYWLHELSIVRSRAVSNRRLWSAMTRSMRGWRLLRSHWKQLQKKWASRIWSLKKTKACICPWGHYTFCMQTIAIIWAWAAGLMTAATILENSLLSYTDEGSICSRDMSKSEQIPYTSQWQKHIDFQIHIFEKNKTPGNKVIISGWGRCNVTTSIIDKKILATKYTRGWDFIKKSMGKFWPKKCYEWFESHGIPLKIQSDLRVFPLSDDGYDVVRVFEQLFAKNRDKVILHYGEGVQSITNYEWMNYELTTRKWVYTADIVVLTTGGNAYAHTGSTGDGYAFAKNLGHTITPLGPSLSSFLTWENWLHDLSGLTFESARISYSSPHDKGEWEGVREKEISQSSTIASLLVSKKERRIHVSETLDPSYRQDDKNKKDTLIWPLLLTHFGISGPLAFMFSSQIAWEKIAKDHPKYIQLAPISSLSFADWDDFLKEQFEKHPKKIISSILSEKLPRRFVDVCIHEYFSDFSEKYVSSISRLDREKVANLLGNGIPITLIERRPWDEFVTAGGVNTDEINPETMESKIQKNLYFAGEILNVDGYTGGFSLQICWSSGYVVGQDINEKLNKL